MRKLVLLEHVSIDGFTADSNSTMDWVYVDEQMFDIAKQETDKADAALYGRKTFELMDNYWPTAGNEPSASKHDKEHSEWYNNVEKFVISRTMHSDDAKKLCIINENIAEKICKLKQQEGKNILMLGSATAAQELMKYYLVDEYWLFINPVVLGKGIPLFTDAAQQTKFKLVDSKIFNEGVVLMHYEK